MYLLSGLCFAPLLTAERRLDPIAAFKESWRLTEGSRLQLVLLGLALLGVNLLGALALGVGLLITVPMSNLAGVRVLRRLQAHGNPTVTPLLPTDAPFPV